jgi:DNA-binding NarL/FixJ family response regulator
VDQIKVLVAEMPHVQVDLVKQVLAKERDLLVVDVAAFGDLAAAAAAAEPAVAIVDGADAGVSPQFLRLLYADPRLKLLAIELEGREASLYELRPHRERLGRLSAESLVAAIRTAASRSRE